MPEVLEDLGGEAKKAKHLDKGKWLLVGIGFVTLIVVWLAYKRQSAANSSAPTTTAALPPVGGVPISGTSTGDFSGLSGAMQSLANSQQQLANAFAGAGTVPPVATVQPFDPVSFLQGYTGQSGPITFGQAELAVDQAFISALGRAPTAGPGIDSMANQIVAQQDYIPTLQGIVFGQEAAAKYNGTSAHPTSPANSTGPKRLPAVPITPTG